MDVDRELVNLYGLVAETSDLLGRYGEEFWFGWLQKRAQTLRTEGPLGAGRFAAGWGGMGGFLDLVIHPLNGHDIVEAEADATNRRLDQLRTDMYRTAGRIRTNA